MTLSALGLFAAAIFILAISPGPTAVALVARVISHGGLSVLPFTAALWIGEAFFFTVAVLGLSALLTQFAWALVLIKWAGVLYLVYVAYRLWFAAAAQDAQLAEPGSHSHPDQRAGRHRPCLYLPGGSRPAPPAVPGLFEIAQ